MKNLIYLILLIIPLILGACTSRERSYSGSEDSRIKLKAARTIHGYAYVILEVDDVEYLTSGNGGFIKLDGGEK